MQGGYLQVLTQANHFKLDPRTKILVLLIINTSAFTSHAWYIMVLAAIIPLSLVSLSRQHCITLVFSLLYLASMSSYVLLIGSTFGTINVIVAMVTGVICRMGPGLLMGYYLLSTTTVSEFIAAMERIHLPKQAIIPLSVMFRFFPTIREEMAAINDAMRMRGMGLGRSKGGVLTNIEYRLVPLLISCVKIGDELSCSALTRGLGSPVKRTNTCDVGLGVYDGLYGSLGFLTLFLLVVTKGV